MRDIIVGLCAGLVALGAAPPRRRWPRTRSPRPLRRRSALDQGREIVPSLIVINSHGASLQGNTLTMTDVSANSIVFADRPVRSAGHVLTKHFLEEWDEGTDSFAKDPPNATVSALDEEAIRSRTRSST